MIRVMVVDNDLSLIEEVDYFEFIGGCSNTQAEPTLNLAEIKTKLNSKVINSIEQHKRIESEAQNRLIDIKIDSITNYFEKQIKKVKRVQKDVQQEGIVRMRVGEVENLEAKCRDKVDELMGQREIFSGFEVFGVLEIYNG